MKISEVFLDHEVHFSVDGRRVTVPVLENVDTGEFVAPLLDHPVRATKQEIVDELISRGGFLDLPRFRSIKEVVEWLREQPSFRGRP